MPSEPLCHAKESTGEGENLSDEVTDLLRMAGDHMTAGRIIEAIGAFEQALSADSALPDAWYNLAYLQRCSRAFTESLESYRNALSAGLERPEEAHLNMALILSEHLNRAPDAEAELRKALDLNPRFIPAWLNLGNLYEDLGDPVQARKAYSQASTLDPENGRARSRMAMIDIHQGREGEAIASLQAALARPGLRASDAAEMNFALGHAFDAIAEYDEAFNAIAAANEDAAPLVPYNPAAQEQFVDRLMTLFPTPMPTTNAALGASPIFICGMFRSGSTLIEQILSRHSKVTAAGELEFIPAFAAEAGMNPFGSFRDLSHSILERWRGEYFEQLHRIHPHFEAITDKRPDNFLHIGMIKAIFPNARIIHTIREPLDTIISIYFGNFDDSISYGFNLEDIAHWFAQYRRLMHHWKRLFGDDILDVDYDALVREPGPILSQILNFCDLPWEECLEGREQARAPVRTLSAWQVRRPLHRRSSGRWQNYSRHLGALVDRLAPAARTPLP